MNMLQGLWIFLIFVCKRNVYKIIRNIDHRASGPRTAQTRLQTRTGGSKDAVSTSGIQMHQLNKDSIAPTASLMSTSDAR